MARLGRGLALGLAAGLLLLAASASAQVNIRESEQRTSAWFSTSQSPRWIAGAARELELEEARTLSNFRPANSTKVSKERVVLQTSVGNLELGFFPRLAPNTVRHMLQNFAMGTFNTNSFADVKPGHSVRVNDVVKGRHPYYPLDKNQRALASKTLRPEINDIRHERGVLSMAHVNGTDGAAKTSFFIVLGDDAQELDGTHTVFGRVTGGENVLRAMESLQGAGTSDLFAAPLQRITIGSSYMENFQPDPVNATARCKASLQEQTARAQILGAELRQVKQRCGGNFAEPEPLSVRERMQQEWDARFPSRNVQP